MSGRIFAVVGLAFGTVGAMAQELFQIPKGVKTAWASPENPKAKPGEGGMANRGAKGHAFDFLPSGKSVTLLDEKGAGVVRRIWLTVEHRNPEALRSLRIDMFWDGANEPAVSVPLGDFFGVGLGLRTPFQNAFFADPEGRSFICTIPMPFRKAARIVVTNEYDKTQKIFFDVNFTRVEKLAADAAYFHAYWNRERRVKLERDYEILPRVSGKGRFLGTNLGVITDPAYGDSWFGEGEVKAYLDGDADHPSLVGTGTEDYIGSGWGQGTYAQAFQGSLVADSKAGHYCFYRYHVPDPVFFESACRVTIQDIGGTFRDGVRKLKAAGAELKPISVDTGPEFIRIFERRDWLDVDMPEFPDGWVNFWRRDDFSSTAYFYLDKPTNGLPVRTLKDRTEALPKGE